MGDLRAKQLQAQTQAQNQVRLAPRFSMTMMMTFQDMDLALDHLGAHDTVTGSSCQLTSDDIIYIGMLEYITWIYDNTMTKISIQSLGAMAKTKAFGYRCWMHGQHGMDIDTVEIVNRMLYMANFTT